MRKIISYLFVVSTACTFSFRKMEEFGVLKTGKQPAAHLSFVCNGDQMDEIYRFFRESLGSDTFDLYYVYLYEPKSKCLLVARNRDLVRQFPNPELQFQAVKHAFDILQGITYPNVEEAKRTSGVLIKDQTLVQFLTNHPNAGIYPDPYQFVMKYFASIPFLIDTDEVPDAAKSIKQWVENSKNPEEFPRILNKSYNTDFTAEQTGLGHHDWEKNFVTPSGISVNSTLAGVKLTKTLEDGKEKIIDFQEALGKYLASQVPGGDSFAQPLVKLIELVAWKERNGASLYESDITYKGTQREDSLVKEFKKDCDKLDFIERQQELLKNSKILTIRYIIPDMKVTVRNNESPSKCTILGTAFDERTKTTFHWVTELSETLEELFKG